MNLENQNMKAKFILEIENLISEVIWFPFIM